MTGAKMRLYATILLSVALLAKGSWADPPGDKRSNVAAELATLRQEWAQDLRAKRLEHILAMYAPNAEFLTPVGERFTGQSAIRNLFKQVMSLASSSIRLDSRATGGEGDLAYDSGDYQETLTRAHGVQEDKRDLRGTYVTIYRRQAERWVIVEQIWTEGALPTSK